MIIIIMFCILRVNDAGYGYAGRFSGSFKFFLPIFALKPELQWQIIGLNTMTVPTKAITA